MEVRQRPQYSGVESLMPKGVEHVHGRIAVGDAYRVESLMPKGVEHITSQ